jgi:hypothetical protein
MASHFISLTPGFSPVDIVIAGAKPFQRFFNSPKTVETVLVRICIQSPD